MDLLALRDGLHRRTEGQGLRSVARAQRSLEDEDGVHMCPQRRYYFKEDGWRILAVYINIYYLYFGFETADMETKVEIFMGLKI